MERQLPVGFLSPGVGGGYIVICHNCALSGQYHVGAPVFPVNIIPYNQNCGYCDRVLIQGRPTWPQLFDGRSP